MSYRHNSNRLADASEVTVELDLIQRGWVVMTPSSRDAPYDRVVDLGQHQFVTIQIKTILKGLIKTVSRGTSGCERVSIHGKFRESYKYKDQHIDWLAGVTKDLQIFYYPRSVYELHEPRLNVAHVQAVEFPINPNVQYHRRTPKITGLTKNSPVATGLDL